MTDNYIQWSKLHGFDGFLKYAHFESERERDEMYVC